MAGIHILAQAREGETMNYRLVPAADVPAAHEPIENEYAGNVYGRASDSVGSSAGFVLKSALRDPILSRIMVARATDWESRKTHHLKTDKTIGAKLLTETMTHIRDQADEGIKSPESRLYPLEKLVSLPVLEHDNGQRTLLLMALEHGRSDDNLPIVTIHPFGWTLAQMWIQATQADRFGLLAILGATRPVRCLVPFVSNKPVGALMAAVLDKSIEDKASPMLIEHLDHYGLRGSWSTHAFDDEHSKANNLRDFINPF